MPTLTHERPRRRGPPLDARDDLLRREDDAASRCASAPARNWYFTYRNGGAPEWLRLGAYPAVALAEARDLALDQRHGLDVKGIDPAAERRKEPAPEPEPPAPAFTFADFVPAYVAFQKGRTKDWADEAQKIERHLLPAWGPLPLETSRARTSTSCSTRSPARG